MMEAVIKEYQENVNALRSFISFVEPTIKAHVEETAERHAKVLMMALYMMEDRWEELKISDDNEGLRKIIDKLKSNKKDFLPTIEKVREILKRSSIEPAQFIKLINKPHVEPLAMSLSKKHMLYQTSIVTLATNCECLFSRLSNVYFTKFENALDQDESKLSLKELLGFSSIEEARKHLIEKKVEGLTRGSINDWINFLKTKPKLQIDQLLEKHLTHVVEFFQRRNLFVHNMGVVNSIYLSKVDASLKAGISLSQKLEVDSEYAIQSINRLELVFMIIAGEFWKKIEPVSGTRLNMFNKVAFEHMRKENWEIAGGLYSFVMNENKKNDSESKLMAKVNFWQCEKWKGEGFENLKEQIKGEDFSLYSSTYRLAKHVLLDEFDAAVPLLKESLANEDISYADLQNWPLFREFRKDLRVQEMVKDASTDKKDISVVRDISAKKAKKRVVKNKTKKKIKVKLKRKG